MEHEAKLLGTIPSKTNANRSYEIRLGGDGRTYCTCTAWKMNKYCKHLEEWNTLAMKASVAQQSPHVPEIPKPVDEILLQAAKATISSKAIKSSTEDIRILSICGSIRTGVWNHGVQT